jgi:cytochrome c biogenesis protein CcdA
MLTRVAIGFLGGLITSIAPCVLPVLPVVLAAGTSRLPVAETAPAMPTATTRRRCVPNRKPVRKRRVRSWRPYRVVAGLVVSFLHARLSA